MRNRPLNGLDDVAAIQRFIAENTPPGGGWHPGDFVHRLYNNNRHHKPEEIVRLWEDESGNLLAWMMLYPRFGGFDIQIHPDWQALEPEMLDYAEAHTPPKEGKIGTDAFGQDAAWRKRLEARGFETAENPAYCYTTRSLNEPIPDSVLPDGFTIRSAAGPHEAAQLAAVHSGAFKSEWTPETYAAVMQSPGYEAEREVVVVAPDGQFAAFCIIWFDPITRSGLFEPVGTHADFQRRGLGRAMMLEGLRRMKAAGMETAIVCHVWNNQAAQGLYHSVGFCKKDDIYDYRKTIV